jgi:chemotaxis protein methyltransferase CheR
LLNEVTIGETFLFRSMPQITALRTMILLEIAKDPIKQLTKRVRIWSAGCSTGEELPTLAICCLEEREKLLKGWNIKIIATDLNDRSVETAAAGIYGDYAMRLVSDLHKVKYFKPAANGKRFKAREELKQLIQFKRLNLRDDAKLVFMKGMDLIYCCNVLIYFDSSSQSRVIQHYYNNLNSDCHLFRGISESLYQLNDQVRLVHFPGAFGYWKAPPGAAKT